MSWGTADMAAALPNVKVENEAPGVAAPALAAPTVKLTSGGKTPQEYGWVAKTGYDYDLYGKSTKELAVVQTIDAPTEEIVDAVGGIRQGDWASNAATYIWDDEYGDVGPEFPVLERQLFGSEYHVRSGVAFEKIAKVDVTQEGNVRIKPVHTFKDAGLHPVMLKNVELAGYDMPTPIQQYTMPAIQEGQDLVACAQTGSGKTAAFLIPILSKLMGKAKKLCAPRPNPAKFEEGITPAVRAEPLVLIVAPSRELATQIFDETRRFCYRTMLRPCVVYGGGPLAEQVAQLSKGCDILIGTPGRLVDFIGRPHMLTLKRLKYMVLDEADEMVGSDWEVELKQIMSGGDQEEGNIIYLMFSATFPKMAREMAAQHLRHDHVRIRIGRAGSSHSNIKQDVIFCEPHSKRQALFDLLMSTPPARTMVFVNSKRTADEVDDFLFNSDVPCTSIHSDRTQREREDSIRAFRLGKCPVLITTGVAARGLDIHNVLHIINYDLPSSQYGGIEEYTHRIGRTGRIGNVGLATSFYNSRDADLGPILTKTLLETGQAIPDFLIEFIPEGFTADGQGDITKLDFEGNFENDDGWGEDDANVEEAHTEGAPTSGGWGDSSSAAAQPVAASAVAPPVQSSWGSAQPAPVAASAVAPPTQSPWGSAQPAPVAASAIAPPAQSSWGAAQSAPVAASAVAPPAQSSWGSAQPAPVTASQPSAPQNSWAPSSSGWGAAASGGSAW